MNVNEVLAELARRRAGIEVHPNDTVNAGQSSNDAFPSAIHLAALVQCRDVRSQAWKRSGMRCPARRSNLPTWSSRAALT